ncbi:MAG: SH3 domain-containing protein [Gemmatimonadetes bacterium]|nr:SH3 domain-containing protein [Gemmatimonadota bacterium]
MRVVHLFLAAAAVSGLAPVARAQDDIQKCDKPVGTLAVVEPQSSSMSSLSRYSLQSPTGLLRMFVQQSNCFIVVDRGVAMENMKQERSLAASGEMQQNENMGAGMMKAADFILTPAIVVTNNDAGGMGAAVGGLLSRASPVAGAVAGGTKIKEAETSIVVADARTTVQVASGQGKAKRTDFKMALGAVAGPVAAGIGGYTNTAEGKLIAASLQDNYNQIVAFVKKDATLQARAARFKPTGLEGDQLKAGVSFAEGTVLVPKIDNVKLVETPTDGAKVVATLKKGAELIFLGTEKDGYLQVQGADGEGWVRKVLVGKK